MVELCRSRVDVLKYDEEYLMREAENINLQKLKLSIKQVSRFLVYMWKVLKFFLKLHQSMGSKISTEQISIYLF